jgi:transposase
MRAQVIREAGAGSDVREAAARLQVSRSVVQRWRRRWRERVVRALAQRLSDEPRSGGPAMLAREQICAVLASACETLAREGVTLARWTYADLAAAPIEREIVERIEMWFSILARKVLRQGNFNSVEDLEKRIGDFIDFFDRTRSKPFRWTYAGSPLAA